MYQTYNNTLCVPYKFLEENFISRRMITHYRKQGFFKQANGRTAYGKEVLIVFDSIKDDIKKQLVEIEPLPKETPSLIENNLTINSEAMTFFANHIKPNGETLDLKVQFQKRTNVEVCEAILKAKNIQLSVRRKNGKNRLDAEFWQKISAELQQLDTKKYPHNLPLNPIRLKEKIALYEKEGFFVFIHKNEGNNNALIVTAQIERLLLSLYTLPNKPYANDVHNYYHQFLGGSIDVVDVITGELFDRNDFKEDGEFVYISEATVWNYINDPKNRAIVDKYRNDTLYYKSTHEPHIHRHTPNWSFSKITMDDRDLLQKTNDKKKVFAYYAMDVKSGCFVGASYGRKKDNALFVDCLKDMFSFCHKNNFGTPLEVEVENHIVRNFESELAEIFPFVRWCNAGNSQEKYAERLIGAKKYSTEKKSVKGVGRHYAKSEANRNKREKIFDSENDNYKENYFSYEEIVATDLETIAEFNNSLHPNQKKYKGMTRLDVLKCYLNRDLKPINRQILAKCIGEKTETSIVRGQYVTVQYAKYQLSHPTIIERLSPNNYGVEAYYFAENNTINEVFIYQNGKFIDKCTKIETFNTAKSEWTENDSKIYGEQAKYVNEHRTMIKENAKEKRVKVEIIKNKNNFQELKPTILELKPIEIQNEFSTDYDEEYTTELALNSL